MVKCSLFETHILLRGNNILPFLYFIFKTCWEVELGVKVDLRVVKFNLIFSTFIRSRNSKVVASTLRDCMLNVEHVVIYFDVDFKCVVEYDIHKV